MKKLTILFIFILLLLNISCDIPLNNKKNIETPEFNPDSAYKFIEAQVMFGPRVPNTQAHENCYKYLKNKLESYNANVIIQNATVEKYNGDKLNIKNIIAQLNIEKKERILLFSHWDTRFLADECSDTNLIYRPIDGANDGASGVGVLLEIARVISNSPPEIGIDIIFFDAEDQGEPSFLDIMNERAWCLGAQYWANNLHTPNYTAKYGICIDMVGKKNAKFTKEDNSRHYAGYLTKEIWKIGQELGYGNYFQNDLSKGIFHDHIFVSQEANIKSIIIIEYHKDNPKGYGNFWHTHQDTMDIIDKNSLKAVGQTVLEAIYRE